MSKQAPPLGNLTRDTAPVDATKPLPSPKLPAANPITPTPIREVVSTRPDLPQNIDLTNVGSTARDALAVDNATRSDNTPVPMFQQLPSRPEMPVSEVGLQQLAGNESTPFDYTGFGAGTVGQETITTLPTAGIAKFGLEPTSIADRLDNLTGDASVLIANSNPINQYQYTEGLTQSQRNSREFFNGLQQFRQEIAPHMLPALQFTPQQLNPGVAGGFGPTAETKGPLSWLIDGPQTNINPLAGEFGASGGGILGAAGWILGRLSPTTYLKGAALDVSRSAAALWEGGSAGISELLKTGDFSKAMSVGGSAMEENYYSNAPQARGVYTQTFGGSKDVGDELTQSYFLAAVSGMTDMPFSGTGNNPLLTGDANRNIVNKGDNFNPFGLRDPLRSGFSTGALEAKERQQGAWFGHGYDQWAKGGLGLLGDIFVEGRIDKVVAKAINASTAGTKATTSATPPRINQEGIQAVRLNDARQAGTMVHVPRVVPLRDIPDISAFLPKKSPTKSVVPTAKSGAIVPVKRGESDISQVVQGEIVSDNASSIVLRRQRNAPTYNDPIRNRYLPSGADPFTTKSSRVYTPDVGINFDAGGAIIPYSGKSADVVPAVLGVGGKPGGIPTMPRVEDGRVFVASGNTPPVTVWDDTTQSFVSVGKQPTEVQRVLNAPGSVPSTPRAVDDIIEGEIIPNNPTLPPANTVRNSPMETPVPPVGRNTPDVPVTRPVEPVSGLSEGSRTVSYPPLVPKDTPNFTVQPTVIPDIIRTSHVVDDVTGTFRSADDVLAVGNVARLEAVSGDLPPVVPVPVRNIEYITAEAISPSVSSADIVRRLTSGDDIPGATYNPRQVERGTRSIQSVVSLARQVTLPGGVRILSDDVKDVSVMKFARLQKKVDAAIIASGMNPSSTEAAGIRRLFDKVGKPLPTNLSPDFAIEVAPRNVGQPSVYVQPAKTVDDGNVTWTGRAARYTETYPLSDDYAIGIKVKYDEELNRIVPVDGQDMKLIPAVRTEPGTSLGRSQLLDMSVSDRRAVVGKSYRDGYEVPKGAVEDAMTPDIMTDVRAAKDYAQTNLAKDDVPLRMDREARIQLSKHHELTEDIAYTQEVITDISTQLTDVERQLSTYLKQVDELPDIGVGTLSDDVPVTTLVPDPNTIIPRPTIPPANTITTPGVPLYHGTRVSDLHLQGIDPLAGATRSEYGTGVWLTKDRDIALSASGRSVPDNVVPGVNRTFGESAYVHELSDDVLNGMRIVNATDVPDSKVMTDMLRTLERNRFVFSDVIPYGDDLTDEIVELIESGRVKRYDELFSKVDDLTHKVAKRNIGTKPDEYELTYVQRVVTNILTESGVDGMTNGVNTAVYRTGRLNTKAIHDVTDIVGDASDDVVTALHNVNLIQRSLDAAPDSQLLKVQLAEAKAVSVSKVRDSLSDELEELNGSLGKQVSDLMDQDDVVRELASRQRSEEMIRATTKDENTLKSFDKELNRGDWNGPCL